MSSKFRYTNLLISISLLALLSLEPLAKGFCSSFFKEEKVEELVEEEEMFEVGFEIW